MTIWARKSEFELLFKRVSNSEWVVSITEKNNSVEFVIKPVTNINLELKKISNIQSHFEAMGIEKSELIYDKNNLIFKAKINKQKLPEDYKD